MANQVLLNVYLTVHFETLKRFLDSFDARATEKQKDLIMLASMMMDAAKLKLKEVLADTDETQELKPFEEYLPPFKSGMSLEDLMEHQATFDMVAFIATAKHKKAGLSSFKAYKAGAKEVVSSITSVDDLRNKYKAHVDSSDDRLPAMVDMFFEFLAHLG